MLLTEAESNLVATIGVYGVWLLRHGHELPRDDPEAVALMEEYEWWQTVGCSFVARAGLLLASVDAVVAKGLGGPIAKSYDEGLAALLEWRQTQLAGQEKPATRRTKRGTIDE